MYRLKFNSADDTFELHSKKGWAFVGSLSKIKAKAISRGFEGEEIDMAVKTMGDKGHVVAEFGIYKKFMFTK